MTEKRYTNEKITVVWKSEICIHSGICFRGLPEVFDPQARPWVNVKGARSKEIAAQIEQCPSGALAYFYNAAGEESASADGAETLIEIVADGPLLIHGNLKIKDAGGAETTKTKLTAFCRCGASANKPFCDGTHKKINFKG